MTSLPDPSRLPPYEKQYEVAGGLRILGSELKGNIELLAEGFQNHHPGVVISTNFMTSSEGGIAGLTLGVCDIAPMGDDAKITDMMPFYNTFRHLPTEISIATGGYDQRGTLFAWAIVVHKDNPLDGVSMGRLDRIFGAERTGSWAIGASDNILFTSAYARGPETNIRTWGQLGLTGEWADQEIQTYGYASPGFAVSFQRLVLSNSTKWNPNFQEYVEAKQTTDDAAGPAVASERMLEALSEDRYGIAWAALMHVKNYPDVRVLGVSREDGGPFVALTPENVANRSYPLTRDAYVYINHTPGRPLDPKVREFMRFVLSRDGQEIIAKAGVYSPLPGEYLKEQLGKLG
jgi:phosphate transport system substrate-binding protein